MTLSNESGTCSPAATAISPGTDPITASYGGDSNFNPSPLSSPVSLTTSPAPLSVTGDDETMPYGSPLPTLRSTMSGFVNGQSLATSGVTGQPQCTTTATITSPVGTYPITCTAGSLASSDYAFGFVPGTLSISPAPTVFSLASPSSDYPPRSPQQSPPRPALLRPVRSPLTSPPQVTLPRSPPRRPVPLPAPQSSARTFPRAPTR